MARGMFWGAAAAGAIYWASKQPGGVKGTFRRLKGAARDIQGGADPMEVGRRFIEGTSSQPPSGAEYSPEPATGVASLSPER